MITQSGQELPYLRSVLETLCSVFPLRSQSFDAYHRGSLLLLEDTTRTVHFCMHVHVAVSHSQRADIAARRASTDSQRQLHWTDFRACWRPSTRGTTQRQHTEAHATWTVTSLKQPTPVLPRASTTGNRTAWIKSCDLRLRGSRRSCKPFPTAMHVKTRTET
jgi:hypothetical protein